MLIKVVPHVAAFPVEPSTACACGSSWPRVCCDWHWLATICRLTSTWLRGGWSKWREKLDASLRSTFKERSASSLHSFFIFNSRKLPLCVIEKTLLFPQVTRIFCYLTVVTLQYVVPIFLILFSTLALKALGRWSSVSTEYCTWVQNSWNSTLGSAFIFTNNVGRRWALPTEVGKSVWLLRSSEDTIAQWARVTLLDV